eukprot:gene15006-biopygen4615
MSFAPALSSTPTGHCPPPPNKRLALGSDFLARNIIKSCSDEGQGGPQRKMSKSVKAINFGGSGQTQVTVRVNWTSKVKKRKLPHDLASLGKMLSHGTYKQMANAALRHDRIRGALTGFMLKEITKNAGLYVEKEGHQNHDEHRVSVAAVENRIHADSLSTECPMKTGTINMENLMALPNITNHKKQRENYIDLCGKIACASIKSLEKFKDVAVHHIKHAYSAQARRGTDTKFVGMIYTNSNESAEMEEIMKEIHSKYVPCNNGKCSSLAIVGDQGTVERGVNVLLQLSNGFDEVEWLDGLHLKVGDFHAGMKFLQREMVHDL